jgi:hypothetical protein
MVLSQIKIMRSLVTANLEANGEGPENEKKELFLIKLEERLNHVTSYNGEVFGLILVLGSN